MALTAFITGATSGIGKATAERLAAEGFRLVLCGRRQEKLEALQTKLSKLTEVTTLLFDVRDREAVQNKIQNLPEEFKQTDVLINNAGNAHGLDPIQTGNLDDWDAMMDINVKGLLYVSKEIIPQMIERNSGFIVNIGSTAGKEVYPNGNVYCASKHAVDAISKGMRLDLLPRKIKVTQISPGAANTEFSTVRFHGDRERADSLYTDYEPLLAEDIAELTYYAANVPAHVCINDLVVTSLAQANSYVFHKENA